MVYMQRRKFFFSAVIIIMFFSSSLFIESEIICECIVIPGQIAFSINLMSIFKENDMNNEISIIIQDKLPVIGIGVEFHEITHWGNVLPRTSQYSLIDFDFIPTYAEGGFDLFAYEHPFELDYFPPGLIFDYRNIEKYDSIFFSQYINPLYDTKAWQYFSTFDQNERTLFSYELQEILYEDLPSIPIYNPRELVFLSFDVAGFDENLFYSSEIRADKWYGSSDGWFNYSLPVSFREYNYFTKENGKDLLWINSVYGSLFRRAQETKYWESFLASNYSYTEIVDWKFNVTVEINPEAKFSDGSSVLAEDVKYTYELLLSPEVGATDYNLLKTVFASNESIIAEDSTTVKFCFEDISNYPLSYLSHGIIDKSYLEPFISSYGYSIFDEQPLTGNVSDALVRSCGPFKLDYINKNNNETLLIPNPYWLEGELSSNLTFIKMEDPEEAFIDFLDGKIDILDNLYTEYLLEQIHDFTPMYHIKFIDIPFTYELAINMKHPVFGTGELTPVGTPTAAKYIRKAISHIIPRENITFDFLRELGVPSVSYIPKACVGHNKNLDPYVYDFDIAAQYLKEAGLAACCCRTLNPTQTGNRTILIVTLFSLISVSIWSQTKFKKIKSEKT